MIIKFIDSGISLIPEGVLEKSFIENTLRLKKDLDVVPLTRVNTLNGEFYLKTGVKEEYQS